MGRRNFDLSPARQIRQVNCGGLWLRINFLNIYSVRNIKEETFASQERADLKFF